MDNTTWSEQDVNKRGGKKDKRQGETERGGMKERE